MSLEVATWRSLKSIYLTITPIKNLVDAWIDIGDDEDVSLYITAYNQRHFLRRLVVRAFLEMDYAHRVQHLILDDFTDNSGWEGFPLVQFIGTTWLDWEYAWANLDHSISEFYRQRTRTLSSL
jgi:hypothetical protein